MATNIALDIVLAAASVGGVRSFFRGFRVYREYLRLQGISEIPIRSIAMGLVRIHGKAASETLVDSPIGHTPCCVYQVHIEKWREANEDEHRSGAWLHYGSEDGGGSFYLEDSSGRVLVHPRGADYDIERTAVREVSSANPSSVVVDGASEVELLGYVERVGPSDEAPGTRHHNLEVEQMAFAMSEYKKQGLSREEMMQKLFPQVMQGEARMLEALEAEGPQSDPLREELRLAQIELHKHPVWSPEYRQGFNRVTKLQRQVKKQGLWIEVPRPVPLPPPPPHPPTPEEIVASVMGVPTAAGRYRITERSILPGHEYHITGTCGENPAAKDADDRKLIRKGIGEPTFLISGLARPQVNTMLQLRAHVMIFGGGVLAVCCLMLLLLRLGQF